MKRALLVAICASLAACHGSKPKMNMTPEAVIDGIRDFADRGCACGSDKECFREIRTEWESARAPILYNAALLTGDDQAKYLSERTRFGLCGDAAGLAVFDGV